MDKFTENLAEGLRRFAMAGVGAVSLTIEKSKEIIDQLVARGEMTAAEGQVACDDLQKKLAEQLDAFSQKLKTDYETASFDQLLTRCAKLTPEQKARLMEVLAQEPSAECGETPETAASEGEPDPAEEPADEAAETPREE